MKKFFFAAILILFASSVSAEDIRNTMAYKLAFLQMQQENPEVAQLQFAEPDRAAISEFYSIMQTLKIRCVNPETDIANTIVDTYNYVKQQGFTMPLLTIARELTKTAQNKMMFGDKQVNFRETSAVWITQFQEAIKKRK